jgi:hypothetical protein
MGAADEDLYQAVRRGDIGAAAQALMGGADANYVHEEDFGNCRTRTPVLYLACERHDAAAVQLLLAHGAVTGCYRDERAVWGSDRTPCLIAAFPSSDVVRILLEAGADPNTCRCWREDCNNETTALQAASGHQGQPQDDALASGGRALKQILLRSYRTGLASSSWRVRKKSARGLGELGVVAWEAVPLLEAARDDTHPKVREAATWALVRIRNAGR